MKTLAATLIVLSTPAAFAESDFPYYPPVEERFCAYEEVTPLIAKKAAMVTGPIGETAYVICEPLNIKRLSGMPVCYQITYYNGKKMKRARKYNDLIRRINNGEKVLAREISDTLAEFRKKGFYDHCRPGYVKGQTFSAAVCVTGYRGIADAFNGFDACYEKAARAAGTNELYFTRFVGVGWTMLQTFEFETENGEKVLIATGTQPFPSAHETSYAAIENRERKLYETFNDPAHYDMEVIKKNLEKWPVIEAGVPDEMAQKEFPKVIRTE
jgi:hypothetical protein